MAWIQKADFSSVEADLMALLNANLTETIDRAEAQAFSYLGGLYDVDEIKKQSGDERDAYLIKVVCDLAIYQGLAMYSGREIPEIRVQMYLESMEWLKAVSADKIQAPSNDKMPRLADKEDNRVMPIELGSDTLEDYNFN